MSVKIFRPPLCGDPAQEVPRHLWPQLLEERRRFCREALPSDCRLLLFFVEDAAGSNWLGFESREQYLREGLGLDPKIVSLALRGLKITRPDLPIDFDTAVVLGKHGGDRKSEDAKNQDSNGNLIRGGNNTEYLLARLDRDRPDLAARVRAGELSAHAAAVEAKFRGFVTLSPLDQIRKRLPKLTREEIITLANELIDMVYPEGKP